MNRPLSKTITYLLAAVLLVGGTACSSSDPSGTSTGAGSTVDVTTTVPGPEPISIVVTNDDGIHALGIDEVARQLADLPQVHVKVIAPATNQSGTGDKATNGKVAYEHAKTASGIDGIAVSGTPADSVNVALDDLGLEPDLIVSGINHGQNAGPLTEISGTIGAALTGARRGIPAIAGSAGLADPDYELAADYIVDWVKANRDRLASGDVTTETIVNINVPHCTAGSARDIVDVPTASEIPEGVNPFEADCTVPPLPSRPTDDIDALAHGFAARSSLPTS